MVNSLTFGFQEPGNAAIGINRLYEFQLGIAYMNDRCPDSLVRYILDPGRPETEQVFKRVNGFIEVLYGDSHMVNSLDHLSPRLDVTSCAYVTLPRLLG